MNRPVFLILDVGQTAWMKQICGIDDLNPVDHVKMFKRRQI